MTGILAETVNCMTDIDGRTILQITVKDNKNWVAEKIKEAKQKQANGKQLSVEISEFKEKRTLSANAYFHLLVDKIAKALGSSEEDVKKALVLDYGTIATDESGIKIGFKLPKQTDVSLVCKYAKQFDTRTENGLEFNCYIVYKETHTLDKAEMAKLIDGTVYEAQQLGIETKTPNQIAEMLSRMEE